MNKIQFNYRTKPEPISRIKKELERLRKEQEVLKRQRHDLVFEIFEMANQIGFSEFRKEMNRQYGYPFLEVSINKNHSRIEKPKQRIGLLRIALTTIVVVVARHYDCAIF